MTATRARSLPPVCPDNRHRPDDLPEPGDRCKDCLRTLSWLGPGPYDWEAIDDEDDEDQADEATGTEPASPQPGTVVIFRPVMTAVLQPDGSWVVTADVSDCVDGEADPDGEFPEDDGTPAAAALDDALHWWNTRNPGEVIRLDAAPTKAPCRLCGEPITRGDDGWTHDKGADTACTLPRWPLPDWEAAVQLENERLRAALAGDAEATR